MDKQHAPTQSFMWTSPDNTAHKCFRSVSIRTIQTQCSNSFPKSGLWPGDNPKMHYQMCYLNFLWSLCLRHLQSSIPQTATQFVFVSCFNHYLEVQPVFITKWEFKAKQTLKTFGNATHAMIFRNKPCTGFVFQRKAQDTEWLINVLIFSAKMWHWMTKPSFEETTIYHHRLYPACKVSRENKMQPPQ